MKIEGIEQRTSFTDFLECGIYFVDYKPKKNKIFLNF